jgi:hypothetical protein
MPQTLSLNIVHLVFSTKNRENLLYHGLRPDLFPVMANIVARTKSHAYRVGALSFKDEFREICRKNDVEIDERYVWD